MSLRAECWAWTELTTKASPAGEPHVKYGRKAGPGRPVTVPGPLTRKERRMMVTNCPRPDHPKPELRSVEATRRLLRLLLSRGNLALLMEVAAMLAAPRTNPPTR